MIYSKSSSIPPRLPRVFQLSHGRGIALCVMDWVATWLSCRVPIAGQPREVLLGCPRPEDYFHQPSYLGASVGRFANRIFGARVEGSDIRLTANEGEHCLHGDTAGLSHRYWEVLAHDATSITFAVFSAAGEDGFPGNLNARVTYRLDDPATLTILFEGELDAPCPLSLTNHAYFNLDGGLSDVRDHRLMVDAGHYLTPGAQPELRPVAGAPFDYREARKIAPDELDHAFLLNPSGRRVRLLSADERLALQISTDLPATQIYSGNFLAGTPARMGGTYANGVGAWMPRRGCIMHNIHSDRCQINAQQTQ